MLATITKKSTSNRGAKDVSEYVLRKMSPAAQSPGQIKSTAAGSKTISRAIRSLFSVVKYGIVNVLCFIIALLSWFMVDSFTAFSVTALSDSVKKYISWPGQRSIQTSPAAFSVSHPLQYSNPSALTPLPEFLFGVPPVCPSQFLPVCPS